MVAAIDRILEHEESAFIEGSRLLVSDQPKRPAHRRPRKSMIQRMKRRRVVVDEHHGCTSKSGRFANQTSLISRCLGTADDLYSPIHVHECAPPSENSHPNVSNADRDVHETSISNGSRMTFSPDGFSPACDSLSTAQLLPDLHEPVASIRAQAIPRRSRCIPSHLLEYRSQFHCWLSRICRSYHDALTSC